MSSKGRHDNMQTRTGHARTGRARTGRNLSYYMLVDKKNQPQSDPPRARTYSHGVHTKAGSSTQGDDSRVGSRRIPVVVRRSVSQNAVTRRGTEGDPERPCEGSIIQFTSSASSDVSAARPRIYPFMIPGESAEEALRRSRADALTIQMWEHLEEIDEARRLEHKMSLHARGSVSLKLRSMTEEELGLCYCWLKKDEEEPGGIKWWSKVRVGLQASFEDGGENGALTGLFWPGVAYPVAFCVCKPPPNTPHQIDVLGVRRIFHRHGLASAIARHFMCCAAR